MTTTQLKKQTTKEIINLLIEDFDAYNVNREAQYIEFWADIDGFEIDMQLDTRDYSVSSWDSIELAGEGWMKEEINKQVAAAILEERINQAIEKKLGR